MPIIPGFTINPVISEQLTDHRKGAALGGLSYNWFRRISRIPVELQCRKLCSRLHVARS